MFARRTPRRIAAMHKFGLLSEAQRTFRGRVEHLGPTVNDPKLTSAGSKSRTAASP
jgi:hypothetical protein